MFYLGIDLGKTRDHTALAIVERNDSRTAYTGSILNGLKLRYAERVPLGTAYTQVAEHIVVEKIKGMVWHQNLRGQCVVVVDTTGVGAPVVDMQGADGRRRVRTA